MTGMGGLVRGGDRREAAEGEGMPYLPSAEVSADGGYLAHENCPGWSGEISTAGCGRFDAGLTRTRRRGTRTRGVGLVEDPSRRKWERSTTREGVLSARQT